MLTVLAAFSAAVTLLLTGVMAGVFYAFSVSVMLGLDAIKAEHAIRAMQSINRKILNPVFYVTFLGTPIAAIVTGVLLLLDEQAPAGVIFLLAAAAYVLGAFVPTAAVNVPMNNALDVADVPAGASEAARLWSGYSSRWTRWNTLRAASSSISLLLAGLGVFAWGGQW